VSGFDVVVLGEALVELHSHEAVRDGSTLRLSFSGDALNAAAAAAAAGAHTALLTIIGDDDLGAALLERLDALGVDPALIRRSPRPNGAYLVVSDPSGDRQFLYWRTGSAASSLSGDDIALHRAHLEGSRALVVSGISAALSPTAEEAVVAAARLVAGAGGHVTYDPNFRGRLTTPERARRVLETVAPLTRLMTPSCPGDTVPLLQTTDPDEAIGRALALGATAVAVTAGASEVRVGSIQRRFAVPVPPAPDAVDATGAGDVVTGTATARLALGDDLETALRIAVAAASLSTAGRGGTGHLATLDESRHLARRA
jgi:2-dehydro-3-deoxygluconokinase